MCGSTRVCTPAPDNRVDACTRMLKRPSQALRASSERRLSYLRGHSGISCASSRHVAGDTSVYGIAVLGPTPRRALYSGDRARCSSQAFRPDARAQRFQARVRAFQIRIDRSQDPGFVASVGQTLVRQGESRASKQGEGVVTEALGAVRSQPRAVDRGTPRSVAMVTSLVL